MSFIIKRGQFNMVDCFDSSAIGWENSHTRVQVKKKPGQPAKVYYVAGKHLPHIKYVMIAKSL